MQFQRLEDLRLDADKTQAEIAEVLHCKREVYRRYEKGIHEIPAWAVIELAKYYPAHHRPELLHGRYVHRSRSALFFALIHDPPGGGR